MRLLHRSTMVGGACGGGRALRRVDSAPRPTLCRSDAMKKQKKRSKRSRLSAALRELKLAAKARDKDGLLQILVTGHRASRDDGAAGGTSTVADTGAEQHAQPWTQGGGADAAPKTGVDPLLDSGRPVPSGGARGRRCASWVLAAAFVFALACVVALGTAPAICCCTCAAWLCGGRAAQEHASDSACAVLRLRGSCRGRATRAIVQPQVGSSTLYKAEVAGG
ncbi:uncharacterized protein LOC124656172 [Lolium rigidum]|uniref:uncharacterized protein LOC124656172 n=1 Tax=Lolium rigidum TaxID=89674 RepID=UPI001F5D2919|nr:uncharacterized protein LOC124656172 [Lolium rigidum]